MNQKFGDKVIDFKYSRQVIKHYAKSFYFSSQFLPKKKKIGAYAVYCFCRFADNIVDNPRSRDIKEINQELEGLQNELELAFKYGESEHPALSALAIIAKDFQIPVKYAVELIEGVKMDLSINRYQTFEDLYLFCYRVASTVGLMMTHVLGFKNDKTLLYAEKLGIAMQLTNILRDIKEDKNSDRIYLPISELKEYNLIEFNVIKESFNDNFKEMMKFNINRASKYYKEAEPGIRELDKDSRFAIYAASRIYSGILKKLEDNGYNPFIERAFVPNSKKLRIVFNEYFRTKFSVS